MKKPRWTNTEFYLYMLLSTVVGVMFGALFLSMPQDLNYKSTLNTTHYFLGYSEPFCARGTTFCYANQTLQLLTTKGKPVYNPTSNLWECYNFEAILERI